MKQDITRDQIIIVKINFSTIYVMILHIERTFFLELCSSPVGFSL